MSLHKVHSSDVVSSFPGNDIKDRSEAHRALLESRSLDTVCNFAFEELGRMNINFDPAWMSGKNIRCQVHRVFLLELLIEADCVHLRARIQ
jgi:hypothetical protein